MAIEDCTIDCFEYEHVFDTAIVQNALDNLLSIASFGGQGFTRLAKSSMISQSHFEDLKQRAHAAGIAADNYLEGLCRILNEYELHELCRPVSPMSR